MYSHRSAYGIMSPEDWKKHEEWMEKEKEKERKERERRENQVHPSSIPLDIIIRGGAPR